MLFRSKKLTDDRRKCLESSRNLTGAKGAPPFEEVKVCYAEAGLVRQMARKNLLKRAALRRSVSATAKVISDKGQCVYRSVMKIALNVQEIPEDLLHPKRSKVYTVKTLDRVPAHCIFLQADGSVGFFVQPRDEWQEVLETQPTVFENLDSCREEMTLRCEMWRSLHSWQEKEDRKSVV